MSLFYFTSYFFISYKEKAVGLLFFAPAAKKSSKRKSLARLFLVVGRSFYRVIGLLTKLLFSPK
jgi:hypothetical protein